MRKLLPSVVVVSLALLLFTGDTASSAAFSVAKVNVAEVRGAKSGFLLDPSCSFPSTCNAVGAAILDGNLNDDPATIGVDESQNARLVTVRCDSAQPSYNPVTGTSYNRCGEGTCIHVLGELRDFRDQTFQIDATHYFVLDPIYCQ